MTRGDTVRGVDAVGGGLATLSLPRSGRPSSDEAARRRAVAFLREIDRSVAREVRPLHLSEPDGPPTARLWAVLDLALPLVWDANYVWVSDGGGADAAALARAAEHVLGAAGLEHRLVVIADAAQGQLLAPEFRAMGWQERPFLIMAHRQPSRLPYEGPAEELDLRAALGGRHAMIVEEPWGSPAVAEQILRRDALIEQAAGGRSFGARADGAVVSHCQLFGRGGVAQVENVGTRLAYRNRGLARAVVSRATAAAHEQAELVFLCADAQDWPQHLYRRLGYEPIGLLHRFCPTLPGQLDATPAGDASRAGSRPRRR